MLVRQHVVLDEKDLKGLVVGRILTLTLDNYVIDLSLAVGGKRRPRAAHNNAPPDLAPAPGRRSKRHGKRKLQSCPYCREKLGALGPHILAKHPGKPTAKQARTAAEKSKTKTPATKGD
jgi:hypothetical protein